MAETKEVVADIEKSKANITKLGKAQTGDKAKAAVLKRSRRYPERGQGISERTILIKQLRK